MESSVEKYKMIAKTFVGLEGVLAKELKDLGAEEVTVLKRAVSFAGDKKMMYKANFNLRTALRILKPVFSFQASDNDQLYKAIYDFDWSKYIKLGHTIAIDAVVNSKYFNNSQYVELKVKDAIVDQFRERIGKRPSVDLENPSIRINIHISEDNCDVLLDSSGDSLHKRGYRVSTDIAPLNEVLAAGMIMLSGWEGKTDFVDPMCGSGTLLIEAALIAMGIPPGIYRKRFGFENWLDFDPDLFCEVTEDDSSTKDFNCEIVGSDISPKAIQIARTNLRNASLHNKVKLNVCSFEETSGASFQHKGLLVTNPPYGERMRKTNIFSFYKAVGDHLKKEYTGFDAWIISSNFDALKYFGLHPDKTYTLYNGALECKFQRFLLYAGSRKTNPVLSSTEE